MNAKAVSSAILWLLAGILFGAVGGGLLGSLCWGSAERWSYLFISLLIILPLYSTVFSAVMWDVLLKLYFPSWSFIGIIVSAFLGAGIGFQMLYMSQAIFFLFHNEYQLGPIWGGSAAGVFLGFVCAIPPALLRLRKYLG